MIVNIGALTVINVPLWCGRLSVGEVLRAGEGRFYAGTLTCFPLNFAVDLKLL